MEAYEPTNRITKTFIELLQIALGNRKALSSPCTDEEWEDVYDVAKRQAMTGIIFYAISQLPVEEMPPVKLKGIWAMTTLQIEEMNKRMCRECSIATEFFAEAGLRSCILKGQSNLFHYPNALRMLRIPGDIDIWTFKESAQGGSKSHRSDIVRLVWEKTGKHSEVTVHHIECDLFPKTAVEVHFVPSFAINPFMDKKYKRWYDSHKNEVMSTKAGYNILDIHFNLVFQMMHIYRHLLLEGIGFRQLTDLYFTLIRRSNKAETTNDHRYDKGFIFQELCDLGMKRITEAVMWILQSVLAMDEKHLLCTPSEKYGREMLSEIMRGGNFGKYYKSTDTPSLPSQHRPKKKAVAGKKKSFISKKTAGFRDFLEGCKHGSRLIASYPKEVLWIPYLYIKASFVRNYWRLQ